ncbi:MAG: adenosylcobinamide-GDP ribazoletransferase, partial [Pseudomonadota bacterium]
MRQPPLLSIWDPLAALGLLTRLPVRLPDAAISRGAKAAWAWPLAGLVVASLTAVIALLTLKAGLPQSLAAGLALGVQIMVTGGLHEDGLADTTDGIWGGWDKARRLEIMRDSRIGAYGVLALV